MTNDNNKRENAHPITVSPELYQQLRQAFDDKYKPGTRRNIQQFLHDWREKIPNITYPERQTVDNFLKEHKPRECWLIDGFCQLLLGKTIDQINEHQKQLPIVEITIETAILEPVIPPNPGFINNPFQPLNGFVDESHLFFGRIQEIQKIFDTLNSGSSVAIIGERQIGKSSLLMEISRQAQTQLFQPRKPIYLNLQNIHDDQDFYQALCDHAEIELSQGYRLTRNIQNHRLLLMLDEVEKMTWNCFTNNMRGQLRSLAEGSNAPLRLVVAGCTCLDQLVPDSQGIPMTSPFTGICSPCNLEKWDEQTIRNFIKSRLNSPLLKPEYQTITFTEDEINELINNSKGHPQKLMALSYQTFNRYLEQLP
jgi:ABC-type branched-chain amino acid transport systems, ATPase component